jgi:hypothetical protein
VIVIVVVVVVVVVGHSGASVVTLGGEALQDPPRIERLSPVGAAADLHEVARAWIHRKPRLDRVVPVVALDQVVHLTEVPPLGGAPPTGVVGSLGVRGRARRGNGGSAA